MATPPTIRKPRCSGPITGWARPDSSPSKKVEGVLPPITGSADGGAAARRKRGAAIATRQGWRRFIGSLIRRRAEYNPRGGSTRCAAAPEPRMCGNPCLQQVGILAISRLVVTAEMWQHSTRAALRNRRMKAKAADDVGTGILQMNPKPASMSRFPDPLARQTRGADRYQHLG